METVWILPRQQAGSDAHGNPTYTWPEPGDLTSVKVEDALYAPAGSEDVDPMRQPVESVPAVFLPAGTRMEPVDRVSARGDTFEVEGDPHVWQTMSGVEKGVRVSLRRTEG